MGEGEGGDAGFAGGGEAMGTRNGEGGSRSVRG